MIRKIFSLSNVIPLITQIILFFGAVTALTLLYLSYRYDDFLTSFIAIGMILTVPWLTISLLPTLLVLKDKELRKDLLWSQLITMLIAFVILYGISVYIGFDTIILAQVKAYLKSSLASLSDFISLMSDFFKKLIAFVLSFYEETIAPLFSG